MAYSSAKLTVRDSFDDEDASDDVEDEVFIRDGRNGFRADEERGVKRPLMAPRRKSKQNQQHAELCKKRSMKVFCAPCCYGIVALAVLLGLIAAVVCAILWFPYTVDKLAFWRGKSFDFKLVIPEPCVDLEANDVWTKSFPKLTAESPIVQNDVNRDGIADVIIGYGTGDDFLLHQNSQNYKNIYTVICIHAIKYLSANFGKELAEDEIRSHETDTMVLESVSAVELDDDETLDFLCDIHFGVKAPCIGGVMALDGRTGDVLWQHWTSHTVYMLDCGSDLTKDGINDCLVTGKGGVFEIVNGQDGSMFWKFDDKLGDSFINIYSGRFIRDLDGDDVADILAMHSFKTAERKASELMLISGKEGTVLVITMTPNSEESYYSPQILVHPDGEELIIFGTGGQNTGGGLYIVPLLHMEDEHQIKSIYMDEDKGILSPPVLVDINEDNMEDIVVASFSSVVLAFDGFTFKPLWNFTFPDSETSSSPTPGYYTDDDIPDFLVKYHTGPGFPVYYSSQTTVLDGRTGKPILNNPVVDSVASQSAAVTLSVEGFGNDFFLYWTADCVGSKGSTNYYVFTPGSSIHSQSKSDLCKLRYNSSMVTVFNAFNQYTSPPGIPFYNSEARKLLEYNNTSNTTLSIKQYLNSHPDVQDSLRASRKQFKQHFHTEKKNYHHELQNKKVTHLSKNEDLLDNSNSGFSAGYMMPLHNSRSEELLPDDSGNLKGPPNVRKHGTRLRPSSRVNLGQKSGWDSGTGQVYETPYNILGMDEYDEPRYDPEGRSKRSSAINYGIQRITSTGTLMKPLNYDGQSMDLVFATYWVSPDESAQVLTLKDKDCIERVERGKQVSLITALRECIRNEQQFADLFDGSKTDDGLPQPQMQLGQMTVYRINLKCKCVTATRSERCMLVLPFEKQSFPSYMGARGDGVFRSRN